MKTPPPDLPLNTIIDKDFRLDDISLIVELKKRNSPFLDDIVKVYDVVKPILNTRLPSVFPHYTLHDVGHSFRIMEYMNALIGDLSSLNELELAIAIYSALLHDIGMAVGDEDIKSIKSDSFEHCDIKFSAMKKVMNDSEDIVLQEYIRRIHGNLSARYIVENHSQHFTIPKLITLSFQKELSLICESHTQDFDWLTRHLTPYEVRGTYHFNPQFIACLLRLADLLDIDSNRTPYNLYKLIAPKGKGTEEWKQHFVVSNTEKVILDPISKQKKIVFYGKSTNPSIHRKLLNYIGWVEDELTNAVSLTGNMHPQYRLLFKTKPEVNIQPEGYTFSDYKMTLDFKAISALLMGEKIYGSKTLGLRELIQNSIDACRIRQERVLDTLQFGEEPYQPQIKVIIDQSKDQVVIKDNGTGMSIEIIKKHFLNIGVSYYSSNEFLLKDFCYKPIGNFGIGFLSCFMLSNNVTVTSRYYTSKFKYIIELEKGNEFTSLTEIEDIQFQGTEVVLNYTEFISLFAYDVNKVKQFLTSYFLTDEFDFQFIEKDQQLKTKIVNTIKNTDDLEPGQFKIDLSNYLNDIEGYAIIKAKSHFIKDFGDLTFDGTLYTYNNNDGLREVKSKDDLNIKDYFLNQSIKYLAIPLVPYDLEDDYLNGLKFTSDNYDEVIEKFDRDLQWISILPPIGYHDFLEEDTLWDDDRIFENLYFENLFELGHSKDCKIKKFVRTIPLFEGRENCLYMPFEDNRRELFNYYRKTPQKKLYIRNVLIKDFYFHNKITSEIFEIESLIVNINSRKFIPDISRNDIDSEATDVINYILGKAIHLGAIDSLSLDQEENDTLINFIKFYYEKGTDLERLIPHNELE